jgi:hypothetical protein
MNATTKLASLTEAETLAILVEGCGAIRGVDRLDTRLQHFSDAYRVNVTRNLRINRDTWIMRDNGVGVLSQPSNLSDWPECSIADARFELARHVWCDAVRVSNGGQL